MAEEETTFSIAEEEAKPEEEKLEEVKPEEEKPEEKMSEEEEKGLFSITDEVTDKITDDVQSGSGTQTIIYHDAVSESAKILVPQMGTDRSLLAEGKYDSRRFTNISPVEKLWLTWFDNVPDEFGGEWARDWADSYRNHAYSVDGENKKLVVAMQQAVSGGRDAAPKKKDERNWVQRNLTQRGKEPEELYDIG